MHYTTWGYLSLLLTCGVATTLGGSRCSSWPNATYFGGYCYKFSNYPLRWDKAKTACASETETGMLAQIPTVSHLNFILNVTGTAIGTEWWIDRTLTTKAQSVLTWPYLMLTRRSLTMCLDTSKCEDQKRFICEKYVGDPCEMYLPSSDFYRGSCYRFNRTLNSWLNANISCATAGTILAEFYDNDTYTHFVSAAVAITNVSGIVLPVGATDLEREGDFRWTSTNLTINPDWWGGGEPNDLYANEDFLAVFNFPGRNEIALNDYSGQDNGISLCQKNIFLKITYLIVVHTEFISPEIRVNTGELVDVVYLYYLQRLKTGVVTEIHERLTFQLTSVFRVDPDIAMILPGISKGLVVLQATHDVTVVLCQESNGRSYSTLVLPANVFPSGYFLLTPDGLDLASQVYVTALMSETRVVVKLPANLTRFGGSIAGFPLHGGRYVNITLGQYETAYIQVYGNTSGTFVYADKPVAVFVNTKYEVSNKTTRHLEMAQPVDSMTSYHVTFPSRSEFASCDVYKLLSHYDNNTIKVFESNQLVFSYNLTKAGDVMEARLPNDKFYLLHSKVGQPFYVTKVDQGAKEACTISFIPRRFWRRQFDFEVTSERETIYVIKNGSSRIYTLETTNRIASINMTCSVIIDYKLYACVMTLERGVHHLRSEDGATVMAAYSETQWSRDGVSCRPLGVDNFAKFNSGLLFPSERFVSGSLNQTFPAPTTSQIIQTTQDEIVTSLPTSKLNEEAANDILQQCYPEREQTSTTTRAMPTTTTTRAPNTATTTHAPNTTTTTRAPNSITTTRSTSTTPTTNPPITTSTTHAPTTATTLYPLPQSSPALSCVPTPPMCPNISTLFSNMTNFNNTSPVVSLSTDDNLPNHTNFEADLLAVCDTLYSTLLNVTRVPKNVFSMLHFPDVDLRLRRKALSAYKRTQVSTWDGRISSQVIGVSGVAFLVIWFIILSLSDIIRMAKVIFLRNQPAENNETRNLE